MKRNKGAAAGEPCAVDCAVLLRGDPPGGQADLSHFGASKLQWVMVKRDDLNGLLGRSLTLRTFSLFFFSQ